MDLSQLLPSCYVSDKQGQQVDVFVNKIRRLAGLTDFSNDGLNKIVRLTFVYEFLDNISVNL